MHLVIPESAVVIDLKFKYCYLNCTSVCFVYSVAEVSGLCFRNSIYVLRGKVSFFSCYCYLSVTSYLQEQTYYMLLFLHVKPVKLKQPPVT